MIWMQSGTSSLPELSALTAAACGRPAVGQARYRTAGRLQVAIGVQSVAAPACIDCNLGAKDCWGLLRAAL